jgi:hypothetical protein
MYIYMCMYMYVDYLGGHLLVAIKELYIYICIYMYIHIYVYVHTYIC